MKRMRGAPLLALFGVLVAQAGCSDFLGIGDGDDSLRLDASTPAAGSTAVSVLSEVTLRFTTALNPLSVPEGVRLEASGRTMEVRWALADDRTLVLTPTDPLDFGTEYQVVATSTLVSFTGVPLAEATSWTFTTRGLPPPVPNQDSLRRHLEALAHDTMQGRASGSADELTAALYLEERLLAYGLQAPAGGAIQAFDGISSRGDTVLSSRNVMAAVPGSGNLAHEWVIVGAHYDHIGYRGLEDHAHGPNNGADDNGSGTVLVLETARALQDYVNRGGMVDTDRRSVLFVGFGAEEEGLLGSCHYVFEAPVAPLAVTRAMLNFDMVGRLRDVLVVSGQETSEAWPSLVGNANAPGLPIVRPEQSSPAGTDHACFWQAGIPWLGFFTDFHDEYHGPDDDVELIDFPGMSRIGEMSFRVLTRLLVMADAPAFAGP